MRIYIRLVQNLAARYFRNARKNRADPSFARSYRKIEEIFPLGPLKSASPFPTFPSFLFPFAVCISFKSISLYFVLLGFIPFYPLVSLLGRGWPCVVNS